MVRSGISKLMAFACFLAAAVLLFHYPVCRWVFLLAFAGYGAALWRFPKIWLFVVPAVLPVLDLVDRTGWSLIDEFDILLIVTIGVLLWRQQSRRNVPQKARWIDWVVILYGLAFLVSFVRGFFPLEAFDANSVFSYLSRYNALRAGKGVLWALAFWPFLRSALQDSSTLKKFLIPGILLGFMATGLAILWERLIFCGLADFSSGYRVTGCFSGSNIGGSAIDGYLALTVPFTILSFMLWRYRIAGWILLGMGVYSLLVTFTRIDYIAVAVIALVLCVGISRGDSSKRYLHKIVVSLLILLMAIIIPILSGPYTRERFATLPENLKGTINDTRDHLNLMDSDVSTRLFGSGVGSFPRIHSLKMPIDESPADFMVINENKDHFLRLSYGHPVFILQRLSRPLPDKVTLRYSVRSFNEGAKLSLAICEGSLQYSFNSAYVYDEKSITKDDLGQWVEAGTKLDLADLNNSFRPAYFKMYNDSSDVHAVIDADNISIVDPQGRELLKNGHFEQGAQRWFFTTMDHSSWGIEDLWLHVFFEQGIIGLLCTALLVIAVLLRLLKGFLAHDRISVSMFASVLAFLTLGLTESLAEESRIMFLFLLVAFTALLYKRSNWPGMETERNAYDR